jgi:hypothetical protein
MDRRSIPPAFPLLPDGHERDGHKACDHLRDSAFGAYKKDLRTEQSAGARGKSGKVSGRQLRRKAPAMSIDDSATELLISRLSDPLAPQDRTAFRNHAAGEGAVYRVVT